MEQFRAVVSGRVQGVCFRAETVGMARGLGLRGYARNLPDGRVLVVAGGAGPSLRALLEFLHRGPVRARVDGVEVDWGDASPLEDGFVVRP